MRKCKTKEQFIQDAHRVHGDKYRYPSEYINDRTKIRIDCIRHGEFVQTPSNHLQGQGCPSCKYEEQALARTLSNKEFIEKAIAVHGNKYCYPYEYVNSKTKIKIRCLVHGIFEQTPFDHLRGRGCQKCGYQSIALGQTLSNEEFIKRAIARHGDRFDYSAVEYIDIKTKVKIECLIHGIFEQMPDSHLRGSSCPKCGNESSALAQAFSLEDFIKKSISKHGNTFDYSQVVYKNANHKVKIGCPSHGFFEQTPNTHSRGGGCQKCASYKFDLAKPAILYLLKFKKDFVTFWKIGITNRTVEKRFSGESKFITERNIWKYENGGDAYSIEQKVLSAFAKYRIEMPLFTLLENNGDTECFVPSLPVQKVVNFIKKAYN
jgi:hypothetical protein